MAEEKWIVEENENLRIDRWLSENSGLSRTRIQELAKAGMIFVNDKAVRSSYKVALNDVITCDVPDDEPIDVKPENIPLDILYEDSDVIVINKPKGMVVHPAPGVTTAMTFPESTAKSGRALSTESTRTPPAAWLSAKMTLLTRQSRSSWKTRHATVNTRRLWPATFPMTTV